MANIKSLLKDTAVYGMSSIVGKFMNYMLVPLHTHVFTVASGGYGVVTNLYAYVALILVILTFGMETTFFRFANKEEENPHCVFSTAIFMICALTAVFLALIFGFIDPISQTLGYENHKEYILLLASVVALDAFQAIPFSYLRYKKKAIKFASLKLLLIILTIVLNVIIYLVLDKTEVVYVFIINLICTGLITFFFIPEFAHEHVAARVYCKEKGIQFKIVDFALLRRMFKYSWPILVLGIAGILNQAVDKMIFPLVYSDVQEAKEQLGIYGGCVKIAMIMAMITQAFRYAYEPIVFAKSKDGDKKEYYSVAMKFFLIFTLLAFLCVMGYMPILEMILGKGYGVGLRVVPIVMVAEIMMGVYFNLSFWYKLIDKTIYGAWFSAVGCIVLIAVNVIFIPEYSYMACAWGGVAGYGTAMLLSYFIGQKKYPIDYKVGRLLFYVAVTAVLYAVIHFVTEGMGDIPRMAINTVLILIYAGIVWKLDIPKRKRA